MAKIKTWSKSSHVYTCRFGIETLMSHYLDKDFKAEYFEIPASVRSDEYYVKMMAAWFFATALAKQWDATIPLHRATPPCSLDAQQDHPEGNRELQNHTRAEGISADVEDKTKGKRWKRRITIHWRKILFNILYKTTTLSNICGTFVLK